MNAARPFPLARPSGPAGRSSPAVLREALGPGDEAPQVQVREALDVVPVRQDRPRRVDVLGAHPLDERGRRVPHQPGAVR